MKSTQEPELPEKTGAPSSRARGWSPVLDDSALPEGQMAAVYPLGVNVLLARVGGAVYAISGSARTWRARCSWEGWKVTRSSVHVTTGVSMFELASFLMLRKLVLPCTSQSLKREKFSSA